VSAEARAQPLWPDEAGASAVEFAIVGPMLIMLLVGIFSIGWAIYNIATVHLAVEQAGRKLSLNPSLSQSDLSKLIQNQVDDPNIVVSLSIDTQSGDQKLAHITADYTYTISVPMLPDYSLTYDTTVTVPLPVQ